MIIACNFQLFFSTVTTDCFTSVTELQSGTGRGAAILGQYSHERRFCLCSWSVDSKAIRVAMFIDCSSWNCNRRSVRDAAVLSVSSVLTKSLHAYGKSTCETAVLFLHDRHSKDCFFRLAIAIIPQLQLKACQQAKQLDQSCTNSHIANMDSVAI